MIEALEAIRKVLKPNGCVYVEVPDAKGYSECLAAPFQDFNTEHINHFGSNSLVNLFGLAGFDCMKVSSKTFLTAANVNYPAVFGFFTPRSNTSTKYVCCQDDEFAEKMDQYINKSKAMINAINLQLVSFIGQQVIVWGAGQFTSKLLIETSLSQAIIISFVDSNRLYHGKEINGISIIRPDELKQLPVVPIIVASLLHHNVIKKQIEEVLKLKNPIITLA